MPTIIRIKESNLEIKKTSFFTNISVNTLWVEKGIAVVDVIANFNLAIANEAEARDAAITAEAQLRIDEDQALAQQIISLNSSLSTNIASIQTNISTLTTNVSAVANRTTTLEATTEDHTARLVTSENAMAGIFTYWDGVSPVKASQLKLELGITYQYTGSMWVPFNNTALGTANQVKGWVAGASSLVVDPITKKVTGWQYGDGSGFDSVFEISADNINLNGTVNVIANADMSNVTTIDGNKLTTGSIWVGGAIESQNFDGSNGFRLNSDGTSTLDPTIYGAYIKGGTVYGATIQAGKVDFSSSKFINSLYPNNTANLFVFSSTYSVGSSLLFVGKGYSSGFLSNRCVCNTQVFILDSFAHFTEPDNYTNFSASLVVYAKVNGGAPFVVDSKSFNVFSVGDTMGSLSVKSSYSISSFDTIEFYGSTSTSGSLLTFSLSVYTQNME